MSRIYTTGPRPKSTSGPAPPRLNIITFVKPENIKQFSLYIQALEKIYSREDDIEDSYYQLSGIHGKPYVEWNGAPGWELGYCFHNKSTFTTWHRVYISLFEQIIHGIANNIAESYTVEREDWKAAAESLRQPYWGWDKEKDAVPPPEVISMQELEIIVAPGDRKILVPNPFLKYSFHSTSATNTFPDHLSGWTATARAPNEDGETNLLMLKLSIVIRALDIETRMGLLYSNTEWTDFATALEHDPHGILHNAVGGVGFVKKAGHMGYVETAGFDPIFWMHHAQVDRVIDIWRRKHGKWETSDEDITPFWKTGDEFWQSPDSDMIKPDVYLNYDYDIKVPISPKIPVGTMQDWRVHVSCKQFELGGSFAVFVFLGQVPADPTHWIKHETLVGIFDVFANSTPDQCANCKNNRDLVVDGFIFLNRTILKHSGQPSLDPNVVVPYLTGKLHWGVQTANGRVPPLNEFPSLEITVYEVPLNMDVGGNMNEGERRYYHDITRGQPGGYNRVI